MLADRAAGLLNLLPQTGKTADTALWNSILECVAFSGQLNRALQLLDDMSSEGCKPDSRTFVALLTACTSVRPATCNCGSPLRLGLCLLWS